VATAWTSSASILALAGVTAPTGDDTAWAVSCADGINAEIDVYLGLGAIAPEPDRDGAIGRVADLAGVEAYKRREAPFGITGFADLEGAAVRLARDSLEGQKPTLDRWRVRTGVA
jgi:hypothetical protein